MAISLRERHQSPVPTPRVSTQRRRGRESGSAWAWALLVPSMALVIGLIAYPLATGFSLSLHAVVLNRPGTGRPFVGLDNYARLLSDPTIRTALLNTVIYVVAGVLSQLLVGLGAAVLLNRPSRLAWLARTAVMLPWFMPPVVAAYMWAFMLDPRFGIITRLAGTAGLDTGEQGIFADPGLALWGVLLVELWRSYPFFALFFLAGLQSIPEELRDATAVDGATRWQHFRHVTMPLLRPVILVSTLLEGIRLANSPTLILLLTNGGPGDATQVMSLYAFQQAYLKFDFGYASSISVAMLALIIGFSIVYIRTAGGGKD
jgi:multiple sugar transport system permease protein